MAATTINRTGITVIDDTGTPSAPNGDGTLWNDAYVDLFLDRIDAMFSGAFRVGGLFAAEGFGDHQFTASGTGVQSVTVGNTTAGTTNGAQFSLTNDVGLSALLFTSSTFTGAPSLTSLIAGGSSGLRLHAGAASAPIT